MKTLVSLLLAAVAAPVLANGAAAPAKPDLKKGEAISQQVCAACHANDGTRGNPANPILQGQHADYLVKQLNEFKEGKRDNGIMKGMAAALSAEDMRHVAAFYASKKAPVGAAIDKTLVTLGEKIYRGGIAEKAVPACAGCHSPNGAGIPAQFPRL
jgi:cytochrome c553